MYTRMLWLGAAVIAAAVFVIYQPGLKIGFLDGWWYLEWVGTMDLPRYLVQFFDPRNVTQGYRPVQGLYVLVQYWLFHFNPDGYHAAHNLFHAANSILLFVLAGRLGKHWRTAFVAGLVYAVLPAYSLALFWNAVVDPLSAFFYLLTLLFWTVYQDTRQVRHWVLTFGAFLLALLSKEVAVFLPLLLFLIERWFYHRKPDWRTLVRQYGPMLLVYIPYVLLELNVQSHGEFVGQFKFSFGPHMIANLMPYLAVLAFPWMSEFPRAAAAYAWMAIAVIGYGGVMVFKKSTTLLFLAVVAVVNVVPLLGFPQDYFSARYLYTSTMASAVVFAMVVEWTWRTLGRRRSLGVVVALVLGCVIVISGGQVADAAGGLAEYTRQLRVPFRDIARLHPTLPADTYLYFIHSPNTPLDDLIGLFFVRYEGTVAVDGTDTSHRPELRDHRAAFVYYFDATGRPIELAVQGPNVAQTAPALPVRFDAGLSLDDVQVTSATVARGGALAVLLSWHAFGTVDRDYAVSVDLLDAQGTLVSSAERALRRGDAATSSWIAGRPAVDAVVVPIPADAPLGDTYSLQVGLVDPATRQRSTIPAADGRAPGHTIRIEPFRIVD